MVDRFRAASANRIFLNIGGYSQGYCRDSISVICGDMTLHEYNTKHNRNTVDIAGYLNYIDTQTDSHLNWLPIPGEGYEALPVFGYMGFGGRIAHMYALTGEDKYIKKYFQIMSDYAQNYRDIIEKPMEGMTDEEKIAYAKDVDTRVYVKVNSAGANLNFAQKSFDIIGSLAVMCKALGKTENSVASYTTDDAVYVDKLDESVYDVIDPVRFAHICKHLIYNEMERTSVYLSVEAISNQKLPVFLHISDMYVFLKILILLLQIISKCIRLLTILF